MHEISIAGAIIESVLDAAKKNNAKKVKEVFLEVGELTALDPDQIKFIFEKITKGTIAEDAIYNIKVIKTIIECKCSYKGGINFFEKLHFFEPIITCPNCGSNDVNIIEGRECSIKKIKIV